MLARMMGFAFAQPVLQGCNVKCMLMHHQYRHFSTAQHVLGEAAEDPFPHATVAVRRR